MAMIQLTLMLLLLVDLYRIYIRKILGSFQISKRSVDDLTNEVQSAKIQLVNKY